MESRTGGGAANGCDQIDHSCWIRKDTVWQYELADDDPNHPDALAARKQKRKRSRDAAQDDIAPGKAQETKYPWVAFENRSLRIALEDANFLSCPPQKHFN
jgi:hypothetical protein